MHPRRELVSLSFPSFTFSRPSLLSTILRMERAIASELRSYCSYYWSGWQRRVGKNAWVDRCTRVNPLLFIPLPQQHAFLPRLGTKLVAASDTILRAGHGMMAASEVSVYMSACLRVTATITRAKRFLSGAIYYSWPTWPRTTLSTVSSMELNRTPILQMRMRRMTRVRSSTVHHIYGSWELAWPWWALRFVCNNIANLRFILLNSNCDNKKVWA